MAEKKVGRRIRNLRQKAELSLEDLAARTGLNLEFLSSLEEDDEYPSLGPLLKVSRALGVRLGTLLDDQVSIDPLVVRREERSPQMVTHRGRRGPAETTFYSLGSGKNDRHMEPFFVELLPDSKEVTLSQHEGEEFVVVISGQAELIYGREKFVLSAGDSIYYNSCVPHHLGTADGQKAEIYAILYFPE